jgi:hypothetical protein
VRKRDYVENPGVGGGSESDLMNLRVTLNEGNFLIG